MVQSSQQHGPRPGGPAGLVLCLVVLAILAAGAGAIVAMAVLVTSAAGGTVTSRDALGALGCLLGGLGLACALWGLSWLVRCQFELLMTQRRVLSILTGTAVPLAPPPALPAPPRGPPPAREAPRRDEELLASVRELSANLLLTPEERQIKRRRQQEEIGEGLVRDIRDATIRGDFSSAGELLRRLIAEFPADARAAELEAALSAARAAAMEEDLAKAQQRAGDLMALATFADARDVALHLASRHPDEPRAKALLESVAREEDAFVGQERRRMYAELHRHAEGRRWKSALEAARALVEKHPDSPEGKIVAAQISTLEDNARIEEVRDLRDRLHECLERRRYEEALGLAREVVRRFPGTAAAAELVQQLPRLEELAGDGTGGRS